ncbi:3-oxoacyl-[acyl-carrier-protein] synthase III C-terminal domain-containing protein [Kitasatospora acidiphila]|uniref:3-oxoacyl-[acyl-carrier-protein] synthase III C-terminal domain-containing protein n=1 Tax=Kitasatospora acidiphila TaxID=2567942 RepID=UPI003C77AA45
MTRVAAVHGVLPPYRYEQGQITEALAAICLPPDGERALGWDIGDAGFTIALGAELPELVRLPVGEDVRSFLTEHDLKPPDVTGWVAHPGGPKALDALRESLGLDSQALELTRRSLARVGNLFSASLLHILRDTLALRPAPSGTPGLLLAVGAGFCSELVPLRW